MASETHIRTLEHKVSTKIDALNMMRIEISPSQRSDIYIYKAAIDGKKTVHVGAQGASDFTIHRREKRKQR